MEMKDQLKQVEEMLDFEKSQKKDELDYQQNLAEQSTEKRNRYEKMLS